MSSSFGRLQRTFTALMGISLLALVIGSTGCNEFDECQQDSDCGDPNDGWRCVIGESGWVSTNYCAPVGQVVTPPDMTVDMQMDTQEELPDICGYDCLATPMGAEEARCRLDGTTVCELFCRTDETADCDGDMQNGCETNVVNNDENCGACGNACMEADNNTVGTCSGITCTPSTCSDGWYDMNEDLSDGCEVGIDVDEAIEVGSVGSSIDEVARDGDYTGVGYITNGGFVLRLFAPELNVSPSSTSQTITVPEAPVTKLKLSVGDGSFGVAAIANRVDYMTFVFADDLTEVTVLESEVRSDSVFDTRALSIEPHIFSDKRVMGVFPSPIARAAYRMGSGGVNCVPTASTMWNRCSIGGDEEVMQRLRSLDALPWGGESYVVVGQEDTTNSLAYFDAREGDSFSNLNPAPTNAPIQRYTSWAPWLDSSGVALGLAGFNGSNQVDFQKIELPALMFDPFRSLTKTVELPEAVSEGHLVMLEDQRMVLVTAQTLYLFSAKTAETAVHAIDVDQALSGNAVVSGGYGSGFLALARQGTLYHIPVEFYSP